MARCEAGAVERLRGASRGDNDREGGGSPVGVGPPIAARGSGAGEARDAGGGSAAGGECVRRQSAAGGDAARRLRGGVGASARKGWKRGLTGRWRGLTG